MSDSHPEPEPRPDCPASADGWEARYVAGNTGWDRGGAPRSLRALIGTLDGPPGRVLVPGCGAAHDAVAWAGAGYDVTAFDFAPSAVAAARANATAAGVGIDVVEADLFDLPGDWAGRFDFVFEQTCYCAIPVRQRDAYVAAMARVLRPGGTFFGLLWNHGGEGGPPFDVTPYDVSLRFPPHLELVAVQPIPDAGTSRKGEFLCTLSRPTGPSE